MVAACNELAPAIPGGVKMKRFSRGIAIGTLVGLLFLIGACSDDDPVVPATGSVAGKVTFVGTWPTTGEVQVSIFTSTFAPPPTYIPMGPPEAATDPILSGLTEFDYSIPGLDKGDYTVIYVGWRDPQNPAGARLLGVYWAMADSIGIGGTGAPAVTPTPVTINNSTLNYTGLNIKADLDLAP